MCCLINNMTVNNKKLNLDFKKSHCHKYICIMFDLNINFFNYTLNETEEFVLKHRLVVHFTFQDQKRTSEYKLLFVYLVKHKPTSIDMLIALKKKKKKKKKKKRAHLVDLAHMYCGSNIDKFDLSTLLDFKAFKSLCILYNAECYASYHQVLFLSLWYD